MRRKTILLAAILAVLFAAGIIASVLVMRYEAPEKIAVIYQDGEEIERIDLARVTESYTIRIEGDDGAVNIVLVEPGQISMQEANCPDELCVKQGAISGGLVPIVCLPHRISISIESREEEDVDVEVY